MVGALGLGVWWFFGGVDRDARKHVAAVTHAVSFQDEAERATVGDRLAPLLGSEVTLAAPELGTITGRDAVTTKIESVARGYAAAQVEVRNVVVERTQADEVTARGEGALLERGDQHFDVRRAVSLRLVRHEGGWVVAGIDVGPEDRAEPEARP